LATEIAEVGSIALRPRVSATFTNEHRDEQPERLMPVSTPSRSGHYKKDWFGREAAEPTPVSD